MGDVVDLSNVWQMLRDPQALADTVEREKALCVLRCLVSDEQACERVANAAVAIRGVARSTTLRWAHDLLAYGLTPDETIELLDAWRVAADSGTPPMLTPPQAAHLTAGYGRFR